MSGDFSSDVITLVFYIILTILLILIGKYTGLIFYKGYHYLDSGSYKARKWEVEEELCPGTRDIFYPPNYKDSKCTYTQEQYDIAAKKIAVKKAEDNGRDVGGWMGFLLGFLLLANKTYGMYKKSISD